MAVYINFTSHKHVRAQAHLTAEQRIAMHLRIASMLISLEEKKG